VSPTVIAIGGLPGAGKSTAARRLATDLRLPFLSADTVGQTVQASPGIRARDAVDACWIAYDVIFRTTEEFVDVGLSVVLDLNLGWAFQWAWLDAVAARHPGLHVLSAGGETIRERLEGRSAPATFFWVVAQRPEAAGAPDETRRA
jgi:predicted kinase